MQFDLRVFSPTPPLIRSMDPRLVMPQTPIAYQLVFHLVPVYPAPVLIVLAPANNDTVTAIVTPPHNPPTNTEVASTPS